MIVLQATSWGKMDFKPATIISTEMAASIMPMMRLRMVRPVVPKRLLNASGHDQNEIANQADQKAGDDNQGNIAVILGGRGINDDSGDTAGADGNRNGNGYDGNGFFVAADLLRILMLF